MHMAQADWNEHERARRPQASSHLSSTRSARTSASCASSARASPHSSRSTRSHSSSLELFEDDRGKRRCRGLVPSRPRRVTALWSLAGLARRRRSRRGDGTDNGASHRLRLARRHRIQSRGLRRHAPRRARPYFALASSRSPSALLLAGYLREVLDEPSTPAVETFIAVLVSIAFAVASLHPLTRSEHDWGLGLLAIALVLGAFAASVFPRGRAARSLHVAVGARASASARRSGVSPRRRHLAHARVGGGGSRRSRCSSVYAREPRSPARVARATSCSPRARRSYEAPPSSPRASRTSHPAHGVVGLPPPHGARSSCSPGDPELDEQWRADLALDRRPGCSSTQRRSGSSSCRAHLHREPAHRLPARPHRRQRALGRASAS